MRENGSAKNKIAGSVAKLFVAFTLASALLCGFAGALWLTEVAARLLMVHVLPASLRNVGQGGNLAPELLFDRDDPFFRQQPWAEQQKADWALSRKKFYHPFVLWRSAPLSSPTIHVDANGFRETPGASCDHGEEKIFFLGGSTTWGWGVPDNATVPAYLLEELKQNLHRPLCLVNMGQDAHDLLHELTALFLELKSGNIPGRVIFLDGSSEVYNPLGNSRYPIHVPPINLHAHFPETAAALEEDFRAGEPRASILSPALLESLMPWTKVLLLNFGILRKPDRPQDAYFAQQTQHYAGEFFESYETIDRLAKAYGFTYSVFLQPLLATGTKPRSPIEERNFARMSEPEKAFAVRMYQLIHERQATGRFANLITFDDLFDHLQEERFFDKQHLVPEGNREVAREIAKHLLPEMKPAPPAPRPARGKAQKRG